jgi:hypothetical protein
MLTSIHQLRSHAQEAINENKGPLQDWSQGGPGRSGELCVRCDPEEACSSAKHYPGCASRKWWEWDGYTENAVARACMRVQVFTAMHGHARSSRSCRSWHGHTQPLCGVAVLSICSVCTIIIYKRPTGKCMRINCEAYIPFDLNPGWLRWVGDKNIAAVGYCPLWKLNMYA